MRKLLCALLAVTAMPALAHRLDEYFQATTISVEAERIDVEIRLAPGTHVFRRVFADIDRDRNGVASKAEQRAYAERVLSDLALTLDGRRLPLRLVSATYSARTLLEKGRGDIRIAFEAGVSDIAETRRLTFENRHHTSMSSYAVNGLVPRDPDIRITAQQRSADQSSYQLDYTQRGASAATRRSAPAAEAPRRLSMVFVCGPDACDG